MYLIKLLLVQHTVARLDFNDNKDVVFIGPVFIVRAVRTDTDADIQHISWPNVPVYCNETWP